MFGNPFSRDVSPTQFPNEKCRWCITRIGMDGRYPIPVCDGCFTMAYNNPRPGAPKGNLWERLMTEFRREAFVWVKRMRNNPTHADVIQSTMEASSELAALRKELQRACRSESGSMEEVTRLTLLIAERTGNLDRFRTDAPKLVADLEKGDE